MCSMVIAIVVSCIAAIHLSDESSHGEIEHGVQHAAYVSKMSASDECTSDMYSSNGCVSSYLQESSRSAVPRGRDPPFNPAAIPVAAPVAVPHLSDPNADRSFIPVATPLDPGADLNRLPPAPPPVNGMVQPSAPPLAEMPEAKANGWKDATTPLDRARGQTHYVNTVTGESAYFPSGDAAGSAGPTAGRWDPRFSLAAREGWPRIGNLGLRLLQATSNNGFGQAVVGLVVVGQDEANKNSGALIPRSPEYPRNKIGVGDEILGLRYKKLPELGYEKDTFWYNSKQFSALLQPETYGENPPFVHFIAGSPDGPGTKKLEKLEKRFPEDVIVFVHPMHRVDDFVAFWEKLMAIDATVVHDATKDEWLSAALLRKIDDPSFIRNVGKKIVSVPRNGKQVKTTILKYVVDENIGIFKRLPTFVAALTDLDVYKGKKNGHEGKRIAAKFRKNRNRELQGRKDAVWRGATAA